jgi:hypothetical protein
MECCNPLLPIEIIHNTKKMSLVHVLDHVVEPDTFQMPGIHFF